MAWTTIIGTPWEYNDNPDDPGGARSALWRKSSSGVRLNTFDGTENYVECRRIDNSRLIGEINKTYYDNKYGPS